MTAEEMFSVCVGLLGESKSECAIWREGFFGDVKRGAGGVF